MQQETQILWGSVKEEYTQNWRKAPSKLLFFFFFTLYWPFCKDRLFLTMPFSVRSVKGDLLPWKSGQTCKSTVRKPTGKDFLIRSRWLFKYVYIPWALQEKQVGKRRGRLFIKHKTFVLPSNAETPSKHSKIPLPAKAMALQGCLCARVLNSPSEFLNFPGWGEIMWPWVCPLTPKGPQSCLRFGGCCCSSHTAEREE